ncbi:response regulator, partial [Actibacterium sp.]|uniref:response regulator n=1 Tax=Actibacterium sp. TaxID=1872125 RepID=UPI003562B323
YGIVKQSGGFIFVDSEVGKGSCFTLYFPARQGHVTVAKPRPDDLIPMPDMPVPVRPAKPPISPDTAQGGEGAILLVEDEAPVRAFASRALRMRGYTVLEAESAEDALELLRNVRVDINVFVTDVVMPGMDGPTWVRQALRDRPEARVVFMSGYAEEDFAETQARIPNSVFLPKPFSLNELVATVRAQVSGPE